MPIDLVPPSRNARPAWVALKVRELEHCASLGIDLTAKDNPTGKFLRTMRGHKATWHWSNDPHYDYACILPNEVVFDIGDDVPVYDEHGVATGEKIEQTWPEVVAHSEGLWDELDAMLGPKDVYYAALSGGKGTHTHLFLEDPTDGVMWDGRDFGIHDMRQKIADWVDARRLAKGLPRIRYDPVCIAPNHGSRQLREFGSVKKRTKTLFFEGSLHRKPLPLDQAEAYVSAGIKYPRSVVRCRSVSGLQHARLRAAFGAKCPQSAACVIANDACDVCPF